MVNEAQTRRMRDERRDYLTPVVGFAIGAVLIVSCALALPRLLAAADVIGSWLVWGGFTIIAVVAGALFCSNLRNLHGLLNQTMNRPDRLMTLAEALTSAFVEVGWPNVAAVADSVAGVSCQSISDWRTGRDVPSRFCDVEPVIAFLQAAAAGRRDGNEGAADSVIAWPIERWRVAWRYSNQAATPPSIVDGSPAADSHRPVVFALFILLVTLVTALASAAYLLSVYTM